MIHESLIIIWRRMSTWLSQSDWTEVFSTWEYGRGSAAIGQGVSAFQNAALLSFRRGRPPTRMGDDPLTGLGQSVNLDVAQENLRQVVFRFFMPDHLHFVFGGGFFDFDIDHIGHRGT